MVQPVISENWLNDVHNFPFTFLTILVAVSGYLVPEVNQSREKILAVVLQPPK